MRKILLIDNHDSFTYNLVQYLQELGCEVIVFCNDNVNTLKVKKIDPDALIFSPGPGTVENPDDIGKSLEIFELFRGKIPILGVCLGHQMIGKYFGGTIQKVSPVHGKKWPIQILKKTRLFKNFPDEIEGMRYHSLVISQKNFPKELTITAETTDKLVMACEKTDEYIYGIQFHPESIGTKLGMDILKNFLSVEK